MRFQTLAGALALAGSLTAFSDSSPWVLLSSSSFGNEPSSNQIQTSSQVLDFTKSFLRSCPTDQYLIVNQPGVSAADLRSPKGCSMPSLCRTVEDKRNKAKFVVSEVIGDASGAGLTDAIKKACGKDASVEELSLTSLTSEDRTHALYENDALLSEKLAKITTDGSYTVLFLSTPGEPSYEPDFVEPVQMDLKRRTHNVRRADNETDWNSLPLFEKYQFFTPGIFMGIIVALVLLSILYVGVSALSSLEVSYGAFEKDMGPAAQKKQQ